jgi:hypothetical protein
MLKYREERRVMGEGGPSLKVSLQLLRLWHVHIFTRYKNKHSCPTKPKRSSRFRVLTF